MITVDMSTEPIGRGWTRLSSPSSSSNEELNQSDPKEQSSPPMYRYAAPNYFATSNYNTETSPVAASAGSRRIRFSSYALPTALPSSIEMQDIEISSTNPGGPSAPGSLPAPVTQSNNSANPPRKPAWLALLLALILFIISIALHPNFLSPQPWRGVSWSREGVNEYLSFKQVIFATIPVKVIWGMFLAILGFDVLVLQVVYSYATIAATSTDRRSASFVGFRNLFFIVVVALQAVFMWGWLLWSI
ncbi:hypothetical protein KCU77_g8125, partial [Aureobasidium melanogenum]